MIRGIGDLHHSPLYRVIMDGLSKLADHQDKQALTELRNRKPIEDVRYRAGVADGVRLAMSALEPKEIDANT